MRDVKITRISKNTMEFPISRRLSSLQARFFYNNYRIAQLLNLILDL